MILVCPSTFIGLISTVATGCMYASTTWRLGWVPSAQSKILSWLSKWSKDSNGVHCFIYTVVQAGLSQMVSHHVWASQASDAVAEKFPWSISLFYSVSECFSQPLTPSPYILRELKRKSPCRRQTSNIKRTASSRSSPSSINQSSSQLRRMMVFPSIKDKKTPSPNFKVADYHIS